MTFKPHPDAEIRRKSAIALIKSLLANQTSEILPTHLRELLRILLWKITQAESSTHATRFQSQDALKFREKGNLRHDHVYQCAKMIDRLLGAEPDQVDHILKVAEGCTVTRDEHTRLHRFDNEYGWVRYEKAGIVVINTETGKRIL
jgi:hypothetical protein